MIISTIKCDKCDKIITDLEKFRIQGKLKNPDNTVIEFHREFCSKCFHEISEYSKTTKKSEIKRAEKEASEIDTCCDVVSVNTAEGTTRHKIDLGKIAALHNAGWKNKDIAGELSIPSTTVASALWRMKSGKVKEIDPDSIK